eukprot:scaffold107178_cov21-Cyclotella_meneghiniana.AAC.1
MVSYSSKRCLEKMTSCPEKLSKMSRAAEVDGGCRNKSKTMALLLGCLSSGKLHGRSLSLTIKRIGNSSVGASSQWRHGRVTKWTAFGRCTTKLKGCGF